MGNKPKALYMDGLYLDDVTQMLSSRYDVETIGCDQFDSIIDSIKGKDYELILVPKGKTAMYVDTEGFTLSDKIKEISPETKTIIYSHCIPRSDLMARHRIEIAMQENRFDSYCQVTRILAAQQIKMCLDEMF